jgi:hypothetical protein
VATYRVAADRLVLVSTDPIRPDTIGVLRRGDTVSVKPVRPSELSGYQWVAFCNGKTATVSRNAIMPLAQYSRQYGRDSGR